MWNLFVILENVLQLTDSVRGESSSNATLLQNAAGVTDEPVIFVQLHLDQFGIAQSGEIEIARRFGFAVADFVDSTTASVGTVVVVAFTQIIPVRSKHSAIRTISHRDAAEPRIVSQQKRFAVACQ